MKNHVLFKILSVFLFVFSTGSVLAQTEITRSFSEFGFENAAQYPNGNLDANVWFTTQINSAGTAPTYYATGSAIRMYPGGGDGNSITLFVGENYAITSVEFYAASGYTQPAEYYVDGGSAVAITATGTTYAVSGILATDTFRLKNANPATSGNQMRLTGVKVTYEYHESTDPTVSADPSSLMGMDYVEGEGPSAAQSFVLTGENLDDSGTIWLSVFSDFEISLDETSGYSDEIMLSGYEGDPVTVYVRLKAGLAPGSYTSFIQVQDMMLDIFDPTFVMLMGEVVGQCEAPEEIPTSMNFDSVLSTGINGSFTPSTDADYHMIAMSESPDLGAVPSNGLYYSSGETLGNGTVIESWTSGNTFTANGLDPETTYYFFVFGLNDWSCEGGPAYNTTPLVGSVSTIADTGETPVYGIGFEDSEGFAPGTVYNNTTVAFTGPAGQQWGTYFGTPSTTGAISGGQSMQMRWYTSSSSNLGYTYTNFDLANVTKVEFKAANTNGINVIVSRSTDGGSNWTNDETFVLSTSAETYTYHVSPTGEFANVRLRFQITYTTAPTSTSRLYIDDVVVYSNSTPSSDPTLSATPSTLSGFTYIESEGPSASQSFEVSGLNMDGSEDVTLSVSGTDFEISLNGTDFSNLVTLVDFDGSVTEVFARLKSGLAINTYNATVSISGYGADDASVNLSGEVTGAPEPFGLPYFNGFRNAEDIDEAEGFGFEFNGTELQTGAGGYVRMSLNSSIVSPSIDFSDYEGILVSFDATTFGGNSGQQLTVSVSENNGTDYTALGTFDVPSAYATFTQAIDVSGLSGLGKIKFEMTGGGNQTRFRDLNLGLAVLWTNNNVWSNGTGPTLADDVVILGDLSTSSDFEANTLTVSANGSLSIQSGNTFTVNGKITNQGAAGNFVVENNANLIQQTGSTSANEGGITVMRMSQPFKRLDYTMWSSPVQGQQIQGFSLETLPERIYTYEDDNYYVVADANADFAAGKGYLFRAPNNWSEDTAVPYMGTFSGVPFNGNINVDTHANAYTSVGNPYPSNIDADSFLNANTGISTLYFWTNTNPVADGSYSGNNYATYTLMGGVGTSGAENDESNAPNGIISTGQGFIVASTGTSASFTNAMRVSDATDFFKTDDLEKHRIWLDLSNAEQGFNQILIGYMDGATNGADNQIDGRLFRYEGTALYNLIGSERYTIQGRALPFENSDVVPLGFHALEAGDYTISLVDFDGLFADGETTIYLKDYLAGTIHNLSEGVYAFHSEAGEFNTRFELVYEDDGSMGTDDLNANAVQVYTQNQNILVRSQSDVILSVALYDLQGRLIHLNEKVNAQTYQITTAAKGVWVVRVQTQNGVVTTKKVIQ